MQFVLLAFLLGTPAFAAPGDDPRALACDNAAIASIAQHRRGTMPTSAAALDKASRQLDQLSKDARDATNASPKSGLTDEAEKELMRLQALAPAPAASPKMRTFSMGVRLPEAPGEGGPIKGAPTYDQLLDHTLLVHAFDDPPVNGRIVQRQRDTTHYSIGALVQAHGNNSNDFTWENKKLAVVRPLRNVKDEVVNLNAYDTFTVGDLVLKPGDVVVDPIGTFKDKVPPNIGYVTFCGDLRQCVEVTVREQKGFAVKFDNQLRGAALDANGRNVNLPEFYRPYLEKHPYVGFGVHKESLVGTGGYWGMVDELVSNLGDHNPLPDRDLKFLRLTSSFARDRLEEELKTHGASPELNAAFENRRKLYNKFLAVADLDLEMRSKYGFVLTVDQRQDWMRRLPTETEQVAKEIEDVRASTAKLAADRASGKFGERATRIVPGKGVRDAAYVRDGGDDGNAFIGVDMLPNRLKSLRYDDVKTLFPKISQIMPTESDPTLLAHYGLSRAGLIGVDAAEKEALLPAMRTELARLAADPKLAQDLPTKASRWALEGLGAQNMLRYADNLDRDYGRGADMTRLTELAKDWATPKTARYSLVATDADRPAAEFAAVAKALEALPEMHSFKADDGTNLVYSIFPGAPGGKKPLVICQGKGESAFRYIDFTNDLADKGYGPILILDHRNQGFSEGIVNGAVHVEKFDTYAKDFIKFMDGPVKEELASRGITEQPALIAHSMGGAIANLALRERPDLAHSIAYISPMFGIQMGDKLAAFNNKPVEYATGVARFFGLGEKIVGHDKPLGFSSGLRSLDRSYELERAMNVFTPRQTIAWLNEALKADDRIRDLVEAPHIRTIFFDGNRDKLIRTDVVEKYARGMENSTYVEMSGSHALHQEAVETRRKLVEMLDQYLQGKRLESSAPDARIRYQVKVQPELAPIRRPASVEPGERTRFRKEFYVSDLEMESQHSVSAVAGLPEGTKAKEYEVKLASEFGLSIDESVALARNFHDALPLDGSLGFVGNGDRAELTKYPLNLPAAFKWGMAKLTPGRVTADDLFALRSRAEKALAVSDHDKLRIQARPAALKRKNPSFTLDKPVSPEIRQRMAAYGIEAQDLPDGRQKIVYTRDPTSADLERVAANFNAVVNAGIYSPEYVAAYTHQELALFHGFNEGNDRTGRLAAQILFQKISGKAVVFPPEFHDELNFSAMDLAAKLAAAEKKPVSELVQAPLATSMEFPPRVLDGVGAPPGRLAPPPLPGEVTLRVYETTTKKEKLKVADLPESVTHVTTPLYCGRPAETNADVEKELKRLFQYGHPDRGGASYDLTVHVHQQGTVKATPTGFFSTSTDFRSAAVFTGGNVGTPAGMVLVIDPRGAPGISLPDLNTYLEKRGRKDLMLRPLVVDEEHEFAITALDPRQIRGAWVRRAPEGYDPKKGRVTVSDWKFKEYIANPNYDPAWNEARAAGGASVPREAGPVRTTDGIGEGSRIAVSASDTPYHAEVRTAADGSREAWVKLPPSPEHPDGVAQRVGTVKTLPAGTPLVHWSTQEHIAKLEREKSISSEALEKQVRNPLPNDNYGGGEYLSTDVVDSISFGDSVIATRTKTPLEYVVSDAMKKDEQVGITQALRNAGFQGVGEKLMPNWVNVTDARFLEGFSTDVKPILLEQLKRKPFDEGVRDLLTWDQRFPITAETLPPNLLPPVRKLLLHQTLEPREEEDLYRAVKGSQEYLFFLMGREAEKRAKQADPSYVPKTFFNVDQARDEFRRLGGTARNPPAQTPLWNAVREFFDKKAATVPGGVPLDTLLDGKKIPLYHLPDQLTLTGWEPFSLSEVSKSNITAFEGKLGPLSSDENRLARDLESLPLTVSTRRASSDEAKIQSSGGILPRTELLSRGDTTPPWPQPGGSHTPRTEEDLYGASDWSFATVSAASWKGSPNYGDALYDVADEYWRTNSWATPTSGLKIYEHYRGIARGPESMGGIKNGADFAGAKLAFRAEVTAPSDYSRRIALDTISFLRGQPENVRREFYAAKAQDLPGLLNKYQLGFLEAKMPGIPVAELKRVSDTAVAKLPTTVRTTDGTALGARVAVFRGDFSPPNEAEVRTLRDMVSRMRLEQVILLPGLDTGKTAAEQRALAAVAFAGIPEARLPSPKLDAELRGKTYGDSVELLARRNPGSSLLSVGDASSFKDPGFGNTRAPNVRYGVVTVANDPNTSLAGDFVRAKNLSSKVSWIQADAPIDSKAIRAALTRGDKPEGLAPGVESFLRDHRAPAVTRAELSAAKDPSSLKALASKLEASRAGLEAGDHPPAATLIANRNAAYEVAARLDAQGLKDEAMKARDAARYHEAVRLETEPRPAARAPASAREHLSLSKMLSEQTARAEVPIRKFGADLANKFPPEYEGTLVKSMEGKKLVVLGAGSNLYNGFLSVKYRLSYLMGVKDQAEKGFYLFDPGFLEKDANGALRVKAEAKAAHPNATILTSMKELPDDSVVIGLTPNSVHADNVTELAGNPKVKGLYLEKPIATSEAELARIQKATDSTLTPAYFGDHYLHAGGGLLSSMGVPIPGKSALEITYDPTGALAGALTRGEPALKKVTAIEGYNLQRGEGLGERPNLRKLSAGGGVGPDLQVHLTNVAHALGYDFNGIDHVEEWVYSASEPGKGEFVEAAKARVTSADSAADRRVISGTTKNGVSYRFESAQFSPEARNTFTLTGDGGRKLKVDFETGTTELIDTDGTKIGEMRQRGDAYLLTMHDAVTALASGEPEAFQLPQQAASVREAIQQPRYSLVATEDRRQSGHTIFSQKQLAQLEQTKPAVAAAARFSLAAADELARARHDFFAGRKSLAELDDVNARLGRFESAVSGQGPEARRLGYLRQESGYLAREAERAAADGNEPRAAQLRAARAKVSARLADETVQRREALATSGKLASAARRDRVAAVTSEAALARYSDELGGRSLKEVTADEKEAELFRALRERDAAAEAKDLPKSEVFISDGARVETNYPLPEHLYTWVSNTTLRSNSPMGSETHAWKAAANKGSSALINWRPFFPNPKDQGVTFAWKNGVGGMAAVQGLEEYGDAVVRLKLKPGTKALHVIDGGKNEFVIPPELHAKEYQVLFRENERVGIREWIVLDHSAIEQAVADPKALEPELRAELRRMRGLGKDYPLADLHSSKNFNPAGNSDNFAFAEKKVEAFLARPRNSIPKPLLLPEGGEEASDWAKVKVDPTPLAPLEARLEKELAQASPAEAAEARLVAKRAEVGPPAPKAPSPEETEKLTAKVKAEMDVSRAPASIAHEPIAVKADRELGAIPGLSGEQRSQLTAALTKAAAGNRDAEADLTHLTRLAANPDNFETYRLAYVHASEALSQHPKWKDAWEEGVLQMMKDSGYSDAEISKVVDEASGLKYYQQVARCLM